MMRRSLPERRRWQISLRRPDCNLQQAEKGVQLADGRNHASVKRKRTWKPEDIKFLTGESCKTDRT